MEVNVATSSFKMAARLAVRSENKLELEEESVLAKTFNIKPFACSRDYTGKPILSHTRDVVCQRSATHTHTHTHAG